MESFLSRYARDSPHDGPLNLLDMVAENCSEQTPPLPSSRSLASLNLLSPLLRIAVSTLNRNAVMTAEVPSLELVCSVHAEVRPSAPGDICRSCFHFSCERNPH
ncbi:hypothetical protein CEXT_619621 [Caerostris extrusa]|uniref:Uncharacterized protein n=1 Tax=Caerostris extrusa TaxID=172846 RepID=A0AAV4W6W0_CAEEX|nr:hypothetical protein CEXT_619621 [Caerostris extrusa]